MQHFSKSDNNRGKRKNSQQMEILLKFMEDNPDIAKGSVRGDKEKWREVKIILNGAGPPTNDVNGWKKVSIHLTLRKLPTILFLT